MEDYERMFRSVSGVCDWNTASVIWRGREKAQSQSFYLYPFIDFASEEQATREGNANPLCICYRHFQAKI